MNELPLPDVILSSRAGQCWEFSGLDHIDSCRDPQHFLSYPHSITYNYNSRGFRDQEWPTDPQQLRDAVWCIGDSYTVGLGSPLQNTWPFQLAKITNRRTINVAMDGASNDWIARTAGKIIQHINPAHIVIMWTYTHRREHTDSTLTDEDRRIHSVNSTDFDNWQNFLHCKRTVDCVANTIQFAIPDFRGPTVSIDQDWARMRGSDWPVCAPATVEELQSLPTSVLHELDHLHGQLAYMRDALAYGNTMVPATVIPVESRDLARDGLHFDLITATWVAAQAADCLT